MQIQTAWHSVLELDSKQNRTAGSEQALADAIRRGADLRIYTDFHHNEHIDTSSTNDDYIQEVSEFACTYLVENRWSAGIMTLRQPISLPFGFGPRPSMSFFLYNQNGQQAIARPFLDGQPTTGEPGPSPLVPEPNMPKFITQSCVDSDTNAPGVNFVYEFGAFKYCVWDKWNEVFSHDANGKVTGGSLDSLIVAFNNGCEMKLAIDGLCDDLAGGQKVTHEVFTRAGPGYYYTREKVFMVGSHPLVRVKPAVPMQYESRGWDFGWLMVRTDGQIMFRRCDPYTLAFTDIPLRHGVRWFVR